MSRPSDRTARPRRTEAILRALVGVALIHLLAIGAASAARTDVVILTNGDRITGEIKGLERGKLTLKTDDMGTLDIEWDNVAELTAGEHFTVEIEDGTEYFGSLAVGSAPGRVKVLTGAGEIEISSVEVVSMTPIKATVLSRIDGSLSLGGSYTRSSEVGQITLESDAKYRTPWRQFAFDLSSNVTRQGDGESTERHDLAMTYHRFLRNRRFGIAYTQFQKNEEQGIDLRVLVGGGYGRHAIQTNRTLVTLGIGAVINEEFVSASSESETSAEGLLLGTYEYFRYDDPDTSITLSLQYFPGITDTGRHRAQFNVQFRRELIKDFFLGIYGYDTFDSEPPSAEAEKNDWGAVLSVGWTF